MNSPVRKILLPLCAAAALFSASIAAPAAEAPKETPRREAPTTKDKAEDTTGAAEVPGKPLDTKPLDGKEIFAEKGCGGCHATRGPEKKIRPAERAKIKGPSLWYAGSKFRPGYLAGWLTGPAPFRGVRWGTMERGRTPHPTLDPPAAKAVAGYLEGLRDPEMPSGVVPKWKKIPRRVLRKTRILFQKKQPCYACHRVKIRKTVYRRPIQLGGYSGPHLIDAGLRLRPDFIVAFLKNPARYNPNGKMPVYGGKAFTPLGEKDLIGLAAYISTFREKP